MYARLNILYNIILSLENLPHKSITMTDTQDFLSLLDPTQDKFLFCCYHEQDKEKQAHIFYGKYEQYEKLLHKHNSQGYGIYIAVNYTKSKGRKLADIMHPRAIFQDDDKGFEGEYPIEPNIVVNTSPGKYQRYWFIDQADIDSPWDQESWHEWEGIEQRLIQDYGNDQSVKDRARVLRLPGFIHNKTSSGDKVEFQVLSRKPFLFSELAKAFPPLEATEPGAATPSQGDNKLVNAVHQIITGENFNDSLGTLSMHMLDKRYPTEFIQTVLQGIMLQSIEEGSTRWQARMKHIPKQIAAGLKKVETEIPDWKPRDRTHNAELASAYSDLPWPPGFLGKLAKDVYSAMRYPEKNIAIVTALHVISTFGGRQYVFDGTGLTAKRILLAKPGRGKDTPNKYINKLVGELSFPREINGQNMPYLVDAYNYIAPGDHTTPALVHQDLMQFASRSMIVSEAGHAKKTKAGDVAAYNSYMLQFLAKDHSTGHMQKAQRQKQGDVEDKPIFEVNVALLHESVPENYIEMLNEEDAFRTGQFARADIIIANPYIDPSKRNRKASRHVIPESIVSKIAHLAAAAKNIPKEGSTKLKPQELIYIEIEDTVDDAIDQLELQIMEERNRTVDNDDFRNSQLQRKIQRLNQLLLVCAVADTAQGERPIATKTHLDWALTYQASIETTLKAHKDAGVFGSPLDQIIDLAENIVIKLLANPPKSGSKVTANRQFNHVVPRHELSTRLSRLSVFKAYSDKVYRGRSKNCLDDVISEMKDRGILYELTKDERQHPKYKGCDINDWRARVFIYPWELPDAGQA